MTSLTNLLPQYILLLSVFIVGKCDETNNVQDTKEANLDSVDRISAKSFKFLQEYYQKALSIERQLDRLLEFEVYSKKVKRATGQIKPALDDLADLCDKLQNLITQGRQGTLRPATYKEELLDVEEKRKRLARDTEMFEANVSSMLAHNSEFDDMKKRMLKNLKEFTKNMKTQFPIHVTAVQSKFVLFNESDESTQGFTRGKEIEFDIRILEHLQEKYASFNNEQDKDAEGTQVLNEKIEDFEAVIISELTADSRVILGRFLPSIGGISMRIANKRTLVENFELDLNYNIDWSEKLFIQLEAVEDRYRKVVQETAVVLKEMMRDEL